jgi:hypothetical protein
VSICSLKAFFALSSFPTLDKISLRDMIQPALTFKGWESLLKRATLLSEASLIRL